MLERDHPVIENMMRTGYPTQKPSRVPVCPICQEPCDEVYVDKNLDIAGCDNCVHTEDPDETERCGICGNTCDTIYMDADNKSIGCPDCVKIQNAWEQESLYQQE